MSEFVDTLNTEVLPEKQQCKDLERSLQDLLDGLKQLKGQLAELNKRPKRRESHSGRDVEGKGVTLIEELKYLRVLQGHLGERRVTEDTNSEKFKFEQQELLEMLLRLRARYVKQQENTQ